MTIVVDTSGLIALLRDEATASDCKAAIAGDADVLISAGTLAECLIVAGRLGLAHQLSRLVTELGVHVVAVDAEGARLVSAAYDRWGKGIDAAKLNFGDCFAYALAKSNACPLLFVGEDFSRTDIAPARRP